MRESVASATTAFPPSMLGEITAAIRGRPLDFLAGGQLIDQEFSEEAVRRQRAEFLQTVRHSVPLVLRHGPEGHYSERTRLPFTVAPSHAPGPGRRRAWR